MNTMKMNFNIHPHDRFYGRKPSLLRRILGATASTLEKMAEMVWNLYSKI